MVAWVEALTDDLAITTVTLAELLAGVRRMPDGGRKAELTVAIDEAIRLYRGSRFLLSLDEDAARAYAEVVVA